MGDPKSAFCSTEKTPVKTLGFFIRRSPAMRGLSSLPSEPVLRRGDDVSLR